MNHARRRLIAALALIGAIPPAGAQQKLPRIGFFYFGSRQSVMELGRYNLFLQGMREQGYEEGKNFVLVPRFADSTLRSEEHTSELQSH